MDFNIILQIQGLAKPENGTGLVSELLRATFYRGKRAIVQYHGRTSHFRAKNIAHRRGRAARESARARLYQFYFILFYLLFLFWRADHPETG